YVSSSLVTNLIISNLLTSNPHPPRSPLFPYTTLFRSYLALCTLGLLIGWWGRHSLWGGCIAALLMVAGFFVKQTATPFMLTLARSEEHTSELQSRFDLVCRLLLEKKK